VAVACTQDKEQIEKEALERMLAENAQRVEEAQRAAEARRVADEEERYARLAAPRVIVNKTEQLSHTPQVASCVVPGRPAASLWALANLPTVFTSSLPVGACVPSPQELEPCVRPTGPQASCTSVCATPVRPSYTHASAANGRGRPQRKSAKLTARSGGVRRRQHES
jgi:hypothetical protein